MPDGLGGAGEWDRLMARQAGQAIGQGQDEDRWREGHAAQTVH